MCFARISVTHSASSRRSEDPCTFRDIWPRTLSSGRPGARFPTAAPRTRSSMWATWRSTKGSCVALYSRWGRWGPVVSSCTRASSAHTTHIRQYIYFIKWPKQTSLNLSMSCNWLVPLKPYNISSHVTRNNTKYLYKSWTNTQIKYSFTVDYWRQIWSMRGTS